jgi:hypothetical protein
MLARFRISRSIITSWILGAALALLSAAVVLASGGGTPIPH